VVKPITLFASGDVMTGRGIDQVLPHPSKADLHEDFVSSAWEYVVLAERKNGPIPRQVGFSYVWGDAIEELDRVSPAARLINLETSITTSEAYEPKGINYRMHPANAPMLTAAKIDCCVLANNHVLDWGQSGLVETLATLRHAGFKTAGAGRNASEAAEPAVIEIGGNSRALVVAVATLDSGVPPEWAATGSTAGIAWLPDLSDRAAGQIVDRLRAAKRSGDLLVLSIHWGANWGYEVSREQRRFARQMIDLAGVDVVHGHSSHHPKGIEIYQGKPIFYGCGDFLNDYEGISGYEEFRSHLVLMYFVTMDLLTKCLVRLEMIPLEIKRFQLRHATARDANWLRDRLNREGTKVALDTHGRLVLQWP